MKRKEILFQFMLIQIDKWTLTLKNDGKKSFLMKPKHQYHLSQQGESVNGAQSWKERRLLCESVFIPIDKWTLTLKMMEREAFLMKPKH